MDSILALLAFICILGVCGLQKMDDLCEYFSDDSHAMTELTDIQQSPPHEMTYVPESQPQTPVAAKNQQASHITNDSQPQTPVARKKSSRNATKSEPHTPTQFAQNEVSHNAKPRDPLMEDDRVIKALEDFASQRKGSTIPLSLTSEGDSSGDIDISAENSASMNDVPVIPIVVRHFAYLVLPICNFATSQTMSPIQFCESFHFVSIFSQSIAIAIFANLYCHCVSQDEANTVVVENNGDDSESQPELNLVPNVCDSRKLSSCSLSIDINMFSQ